MKLLIDIGNTNSSMSLWDNSKLSMVNNSSNKKLFVALRKYSKKNLEKIIFISVVSIKENKVIKNQLKKIFKCNVEQIKSSPKLFGVINGYERPKKLGDDRWSAIVGSYIFYQEPLIIVDCGTAISIDIINSEGVHQGGYILGGFNGYTESFQKAYNLKNIRLKESTILQKKSFPRKTETGITEGYLLMVLSTVENIYYQFRKNQKISPKLLISGGYGKIISKKLSVKNLYEPDLVLKSIGLIEDHSNLV